MRYGRLENAVFFIALLASALALCGALAHLLELPNKIDLPRDEYFIVQSIYSGWNRLAYLLVVQVLSIIAVAAVYRNEKRVMWLALVALACLAGAQLVFWAYTFPANVATENWTTIPQNWESVRSQWEYSHAVGALFQILTMSALIASLLARGRVPRSR